MPTQTFWNLPVEKREALIEIAINEFADHDFQNASLSRIVARAGIAKGSIYQYFTDKQDLFLYLLEYGAEEKQTLFQRHTPPDPTMNLFDQLRWLFSIQAEFEMRHPRLAEVAYRAFYRDLPFEDERLQTLRGSGAVYFRQVVEAAMAKGEIDPALDPALVSFVFQTLFGEIGRFLMGQLAVTPGQIASHELDAATRQRMNALFDQFVGILQYGMGPGRAGLAPTLSAIVASLP